MSVSAATAQFIGAMGQHVSSVCVISTLFEGKRYGLTATAMSSVCAEPPRLLVCVNKSGISHDMIKSAGIFCVNVLDERQDNVAKGFAGMMGKEFDRFSIGKWHRLHTGAPALSDAAAVFDCRLAQVIDQFTHSIFIGDVLDVRANAGRDTLLYGARKFRTLHKPLAEYPTVADDALHF